MNLLELKKHFRALSGRYDLIDDDPSNTVNFLINQASRWLDRQTEHQKSFGSHFSMLQADSYSLSIPLCRAVKEVWASSTTARWQIEKKDLQDICATYLSSAPVSSDVTYYSPVITRKIPEDADLSSFSSYMAFLDTITNLSHSYNGIVIVPPASVNTLIEVRGYYYSSELSDPDDQNFWSVVHPMTLLKASLRELEVFNQNATKVELWEKALMIELADINKDLIHELIAEADNMEPGEDGDIS